MTETDIEEERAQMEVLDLTESITYLHLRLGEQENVANDTGELLVASLEYFTPYFWMFLFSH